MTPLHILAKDAPDLAEILHNRADVYELLAGLFARECSPAQLDALAAVRMPANTGNDDLDLGWRLVADYLARRWERTEDDLRRDFVRAFVGAGTTGASAAYPNESVYAGDEHLVLQTAADEVEAIYASMGVPCSATWTGGPDHVACELAYLAELARRAELALSEGDLRGCTRALFAGEHFLCDHLGTWEGRFTGAMLSFSRTDFYRGLAHVLHGYLAEDRALLDELLVGEQE